MTFLDDRLGGTRTSRHKVFAEPSVSMKIKPAASTDINLGYSMSWSMPEISTLYGGAVLSDYRSLTRYAADLTEGMRNHFSLGLSYKDIFNMLFLNLSAVYSLTKPDILYGYDFDGIYSTTLTTRTGELSHTVSAGIELSKGFYWKDLTAKLELGASWTDSPFLLQEQVARMSMQGYSAGLDISLSPFKFLGLTYNGSVMYSLSRQASGENLTPLLTASNDLTLSFRLPAGIGTTTTAHPPRPVTSSFWTPPSATSGSVSAGSSPAPTSWTPVSTSTPCSQPPAVSPPTTSSGPEAICSRCS